MPEATEHDDLPDIHVQKLGLLAEDYVNYKLTENGFEAYHPKHPITGTDVLVMIGRMGMRIEVKSTTRGRPIPFFHLPNRRTSKPKMYEEEAVDILIALDLRTKDLLVIPTSALKRGQHVTISPRSEFWRFKDDFDQIRQAAERALLTAAASLKK